MGLIDYKISKVFASEFNAETEVYPSSIKCSILDRCNHWTRTTVSTALDYHVASAP